MQPAYIRVVAQRHSNDCAVCCLCMILGISYEAALVAISGVDPSLGTNGLFFTQLKKAARALGFTLKSLKKGSYEMQDSVGILSVKLPKKIEHAVVLFRGTIIDPEDGEVWDDVEAYLADSEAKVSGSLLVLA